MKKTLLPLLVVAFVIVGCSHKEVTPTIPLSIKRDAKSTVQLPILLKLNQASELQNRRNYSHAIKVYDSIIDYYSTREDKGVLSSVYINKFECSLLINRNYKKDNVEDFLKRFGDNPDEVMRFELLYILDAGKSKSMDSAIEHWSSQYRNRRLRGWTFKYIDDWIRRLEDVNARNRLNRYVSIFKKFL